MLAESFREHNPDAGLCVLVVDPHADARPEFPDPVEVLAPADVGVDREELDRLRTMYAAQPLVSSLKSRLVSKLMSRGETALLIDADGCVYGGLETVAEVAGEHGLVLSPHSLDPHPLDRDPLPEQYILMYGVHNGGFLGVGPGAEAFCDWWARRSARYSVMDPHWGLALTQTWLTLATTYFPHHVLRDRGVNVMGWNIHRRDVEWDGDRPMVDGGPLRHFHFAGKFDPLSPETLAPAAREEYWPTLAERPGIARLCREYAERVIAAGHPGDTVGEAELARGGEIRIEPWMRERYRRALIAAERDGSGEPPNPFRDGWAAFAGWLGPPPPPGSETERLRAELERAAGDLERADAVLADLSRELELVRGSRSWRLTAPLRGLGRIARRRIREGGESS